MADLLNGTGEYGFSENSSFYSNEINSFAIQEKFDSTGRYSLVGIDLTTAQEIEQAVNKTIDLLQTTVKEFGGDGKEVFEVAIKGKVVDAAWKYTQEIKELINRYIMTLQDLSKLAHDAIESIKKGDSENRTAIENSSEDIKSIRSDVQEREQGILSDLMSGYGGSGN